MKTSIFSRSAIRLTLAALALACAAFGGTINPTTQYTSIELYLGAQVNGINDPLTMVSNTVTATAVTLPGGVNYISPGGVNYQVYKLTFTGFEYSVNADTVYNFGVFGVGGPPLQVLSSAYGCPVGDLNSCWADNNGLIQFASFSGGTLLSGNTSNTFASDVNVEVNQAGVNLYPIRAFPTTNVNGPIGTRTVIAVNASGNGDVVLDDFYVGNATVDSLSIFVITPITADTTVPEPATFGFIGVGLAVLAYKRFRK